MEATLGRSPSSEPDILEIALTNNQISNNAVAIISQYRRDKQLTDCHTNLCLKKSANIRAKEILTLYSHLRPDGTEGLKAPYAYGYPKENFVAREVIVKMQTNDFLWLKDNAAQKILDLFLESVEDFLVGDVSDEHAVGVCIEKRGTQYELSAVYVCAETAGDTEIVESKPRPVDKSKLVNVYNESTDFDEFEYSQASWTDFILAKGDAKGVYMDQQATQEQVDNAVAALEKAINCLHKEPWELSDFYWEE